MGRSCQPAWSPRVPLMTHCPVLPLPSSLGRHLRLFHPFTLIKVLGRLSYFSSSPFPPISSGVGPWEAVLGGGARAVASLPVAVGLGPATLTRLLGAQDCPSCEAQGSRGVRLTCSHPEERNVAAHPLNPPPCLVLLPLLPRSATTDTSKHGLYFLT